MQLWKITFDCAAADEEGWLLTELGINAWEVISATQLECFFKTTRTDLEAFLNAAAKAGLKCAACEAVDEVNWVQRCREGWQSAQAGALRILPILDDNEDQNRPFAADEIGILPALGFGTGHHASTRMALELLQHIAVSALRPQTVLDIGTGSAVLALAAAKLYGAAVEAVDNDPLALENAAVNLRLNRLQEGVRLRCDDISRITGSFDLVLANLYAELLCAHEDRIRNVTRAGGVLIISGIMEELLETVRRRYGGDCWEIADQRQSEGWCAALLVRLR